MMTTTKYTANKILATITIIVVSYNSAKTIGLCLDAIFNQTLTSDQVDIIIVDNDSTDETCQIIHEHRLPLTLINLEKNIGFGQANNVALAQVNTPFVALVNPDCELYPDWLCNMLDFMQSDTKVAIAGSKLFFSDGIHLQHVGGNVHANGITSHKGDGERDIRQYESAQYCDYVTGVAICCCREVIEEAGYFDPQYFLYYEETDLCYCVSAMGWNVKYCPTACAIHHEQASFGHRLSHRYLFLYHSSRLKFIAKHRQYGLFPKFLKAEYQWFTSISKRQWFVLLAVYSVHLFSLIRLTNLFKVRHVD